MGENRKFYKDLENSSFKMTGNVKAHLRCMRKSEKKSSNQVVITHEEIHILRQQTSVTCFIKFHLEVDPTCVIQAWKRLRQKKSLLSHQKIHAGEKSYECQHAWEGCPSRSQYSSAENSLSGEESLWMWRMWKGLWFCFTLYKTSREFILVRNTVTLRMWENLCSALTTQCPS